jgi:hypothetical protein
LHPEVRDSVNRCGKAKDVISAGTLAYVHWRGARVAPEAADSFVDAIATGANLAEDSPARVLRETLLRNKGPRKKKLQQPVILAYTIKAFNAHARGEPMRVLSWKTREGFPDFISSEQSRGSHERQAADDAHDSRSEREATDTAAESLA